MSGKTSSTEGVSGVASSSPNGRSLDSPSLLILVGLDVWNANEIGALDTDAQDTSSQAIFNP